jgi:hypothetical protein
MIILIVVAVLLLTFPICVLIRNQKVYSYRKQMAAVVFSASVWDYKWRSNIMESVTYNDMMRMAR